MICQAYGCGKRIYGALEACKIHRHLYDRGKRKNTDRGNWSAGGSLVDALEAAHKKRTEDILILDRPMGRPPIS